MMKNAVIERIYVKGSLTAQSPIACGSGEDKSSDKDFIRDHEGRPYLPGTSIAGVIRHELEKRMPGGRGIASKVFGSTENPALSLLSFFDADLENGNVRLRDGVELDAETRTAAKGKKYDYEILETGARFNFRIEAAIRKASDAEEARKAVAGIIELLREGVYMGSKTRRGNGNVKMDGVSVMSLDMKKPDDVKKWIDFDWNNFSDSGLLKQYGNVLNDSTGWSVEADFCIPYSLIIRSYGLDPGDPDASQLHCSGLPVIPGTSWNGAIRHAIMNVLDELRVEKKIIDMMMDSLFGFVREDRKSHSRKKPLTDKEPDNARASRICIDESIIEGSKSLRYVRNKIDRFTGGVVESALFDEKPVYNGKVKLNIRIRDAQSYEKALVLLALKEIGLGIQPVGGGANVGRGVLELKELKIEGESLNIDKALSLYSKSLTGKLSGGKDE
jgi:CRISPR/Cas system CSM-associated protein Csm3 (group 7 of RAMP superfamily)